LCAEFTVKYSMAYGKESKALSSIASVLFKTSGYLEEAVKKVQIIFLLNVHVHVYSNVNTRSWYTFNILWTWFPIKVLPVCVH